MTDIAFGKARPLGRSEYKTLTLAALGGALEFYDFVIYVFLAVVLTGLFFPPDMPEWLATIQTFGIFAAGYFARPLGGVLMAHFGDLLGRKRIFAFSIFLMAISTLGIGLLPTYASIGYAAPILLLVLRVLQGAAIGGEVPGAWVFTAEHVPARHIGFATGTLTCGLTAGILIGSLVATGLNTVYTPIEVHDFAWRYPFILGGVFGLVGVWLRRFLDETPVFRELQKRKALAETLPLKQVVQGHIHGIVICMVLTWLLSAAIVTIILMTPTFLQKVYGFDALTSLKANSLATLTLSVGCIVAGLTIDRIGAGRFFVFGTVLLASTSYAFYTLLFTRPDLLLPLYALVGFAVGSIGGVPYVLVRSFPASVRFSGVSFSYNVAYAIFGGLTPVFLPVAMQADKLAPAHYILFVSVLGFLAGLYFLKKKI
ncbi:MFS transporter [Terrihabitans soli]|uniref:MFS transporter n=1 Tax=Terrihabitans soli TaxID=708113 RepID=A0A6S6QRL8_9HYPH|nr:MFS transporter [Terrihabitans soli]BCJ91689.1 MFS transporter [Terrihabitans soli]